MTSTSSTFFRTIALALAILLGFSAACRESADGSAPLMPADAPLRYLALGDSYTIGESVRQEQSFPYQLAAALQTDAALRVNPTVIARTGWRSDNLLDAIAREKPTVGQDLVTVLIGVNDQFQGRSLAGFRQNFLLLLDKAESLAKAGKEDVIVVTIPDYSVTPYAAGSDTVAIRRALEQFNELVLAEAQARGIATVNITPGSKLARNNPNLLANDGLHPSGVMYANWVAQLVPVARDVLKN